MRPDDDGDLAACRALLRKGSKSFSAAALLLPAHVRDPATVLYAFCRVCDDAIDDNPSATVSTVAELSARLDRIYEGRPDPSPVDRALSNLVLRMRIPRAPFDALLEGFVWDAENRRYETLDDLYAYAARVAGAVGIMMTVVMGPRAPHILARACDLGVAMQLTNVARDVGEDASRGRIYLPLAWMREANLDPDRWLENPRPLPALVARLLSEAEKLYRQADIGIGLLPPDCRTAIRAARLIYSDIGRSIERANFDSVSSRAFVSTRRKVWLLARSMRARFKSSPDAHTHRAPPLDATAFLVSACAE